MISNPWLSVTKWLNLWKAIWLPSISLLCFLLIHRVVEDASERILVEPFLSKIQFSGDIVEQFALAALLTITVFYFAKKCTLRYKYSTHRLAWIVAIVLGYVYLRFLSDRWIYTNWFTVYGYSLKAADLILLLPVPFLSALHISKLDGDQLNGDSGFNTDEPFRIEAVKDKHQRWRYIESIILLLKKTNISKRAFAIGISGIWGSGKTTFINALESHLCDAFIQIHFNPWRISESKGITEVFFHELSYQLSLRMDTLSSDMMEYIRAITTDKASNPVLGIIRKSLPGIHWNRSSIEELRTRINNSLNDSGKRFVIYIDDLDRLDDEEIIETLRIIRNSADFANLIFVVAYDKAQVATALGEKFKHGSNKYLEKVFQYEFHLPPLDRDELLDELNNQLALILSDDDNKSRKAMFDKQAFSFDYSSLKNYLDHYRDVARYTNVFKVHYPFLKGQVFVPDLYKVLFLRLKYPGVANLIYERRSEFLTNFSSFDISREGEDSKYIQLERSEDGNAALIFGELKEHGIKYGIEKADVDEVMDMLSKIFPDSDNFLLTNNKVPGSEFTIRDVDYFDRYFDEDLTSRLSNIEFQAAFKESKEAFLEKIGGWLSDGQVASDLIKTLERREQFNSKEDYDKALSALALIADYPGEENNYPFYWRIDERKAFGRFAYEGENRRSKTLKLFGDKETFKEYILNFLKTDMRYRLFRFRMVEKFTEIDYDLLLTKNEAIEVIKSVFAQMIESGTETSLELLRVYNLLIRLLPGEEHRQVKDKLKTFIFSKDIDGFIKWIILPVPFTEDVYTIDDWAKQLFDGSLDTFVEKLKSVDTVTEGQGEFLDFYVKYKVESESKRSPSFDFKKIPVRKANEE